MTRRTDDLRAAWDRRGYQVTDADVARAKSRIAAAATVSDEEHQRNLEWLRQFDSDAPAAAA